MNIAADNTERERLRRLGWQIADPHCVARTPGTYAAASSARLPSSRRLRASTWHGTGWVSDRAAAFLAFGRPVITEAPVHNAISLPNRDFVLSDRSPRRRPLFARCLRLFGLSKQARHCAVEVFGSVKNLGRILCPLGADLPFRNDFRVMFVAPLWLT